MNTPATLQLLHDGITQGLHIGAQVYASIDGQAVIDLAVGNARLAAHGAGTGGGTGGETDVPMATDTLMLWLSAGKPITAAGILMLWEKGLLQLDETVATYIPEFGRNGKDQITVRQLLTHTGGFRGVDASYPFATWDDTLARIYDMPLERAWVPGMKAGYHTHTSWYVLGELINRLNGVRVETWLRENILLPLGMTDSFLAMDAATYHHYGTRIGYLYDTTSQPPAPVLNYDTELAASRGRPSGSMRGPIRQLARFYEMLRRGGELDGTRLLKEETVFAMTMRQRVGLFDQTFQKTIDWGLGIIINSAHYGPGIPYQFGPHASPGTFGHGGSQSSTGFCDPQRKLVVTMVFNGCPGEPAHDRRLRAVLKALYEDLGLA